LAEGIILIEGAGCWLRAGEKILFELVFFEADDAAAAAGI
jgi:hypothetical protein